MEEAVSSGEVLVLVAVLAVLCIELSIGWFSIGILLAPGVRRSGSSVTILSFSQ